MRAYAESHLVSSAALPLTCLLHSFDRVQNPWYLGGNIVAGLPGGVEIAAGLMARTWLSAHDEDKESSGIAVRPTVTRKYAVDEVRRVVGRRVGKDGGGAGTGTGAGALGGGGGGAVTDIRVLSCGQEIVLEA